MRGDLEDHMKICPFRSFECKFCKKVSTYYAITGQKQTEAHEPALPPQKGHYAVCPQYPLSCRNKCDQREIRRTDMEQHLKECPLEQIRCERWDEGCKCVVPRKNMKAHVKEDMTQHYKYLCFAYNQKSRDVEAVKKQFEAEQAALYQAEEELEKARIEERKAKKEHLDMTKAMEEELEKVRVENCKAKKKVLEMTKALEETKKRLELANKKRYNTVHWFAELAGKRKKEVREAEEKLQITKQEANKKELDMTKALEEQRKVLEKQREELELANQKGRERDVRFSQLERKYNDTNELAEVIRDRALAEEVRQDNDSCVIS